MPIYGLMTSRRSEYYVIAVLLSRIFYLTFRARHSSIGHVLPYPSSKESSIATQMKPSEIVHRGSPASLAVLVNTCDKFEDCWRPFFVLWNKFGLKTINHTVYLNTERKSFDSMGGSIHSLRVCDTNDWTGPKPPTWSWCLEKALDSIPEDFVLYLQEDYFLTAPVNEARLADLLRWMAAHPDAGCVRIDCAGKSTPGPEPGLRTCDPKWWYFVTCQAAVWRKDVLRGLIREHEDAWQFERWASKRARMIGCHFFALEPESGLWPAQYLKTGVIQGKWFEPVVPLFRKHGIAMDFSQRGFYEGKYGRRNGRPFAWLLAFLLYNAKAFVFRYFLPWSSFREIVELRFHSTIPSTPPHNPKTDQRFA